MADAGRMVEVSEATKAAACRALMPPAIPVALDGKDGVLTYAGAVAERWLAYCDPSDKP